VPRPVLHRDYLWRRIADQPVRAGDFWDFGNSEFQKVLQLIRQENPEKALV
jgi:hypothetical protein